VQGSILSHECAVASNLAAPEETDRVFIVTSHNCDIAERDLEKEPFIEVVEAFEIETCSPNLTNSKSTRILHIEALKDGNPVNLELRAVTKKSTDKSKIELFAPLNNFELADDGGNNLSHWLAARYKRAAFPNKFLERLGRKITDAISNSAKKSPHAVIGIFLDYDPEREIEAPTELYELWVYVVYSSEVESAENVANEIAIDLRQRLERAFKKEGSWSSIELRKCEPISDLSFSLYEAKRMKFFRLDHISLRESPQAELPDVS
jgi:hypothetical protein